MFFFKYLFILFLNNIHSIFIQNHNTCGIYNIQPNYIQYYEYSMISYCNQNNILELNLGSTSTQNYLKQNILINHIFYNNSTNNLLWFFETKSHLHIIYRGTEFNSFDNWQKNLQIKQEPYNSITMNCHNCYIHNGFNEMYSSVSTPFLNIFYPYLLNSNKNIIISGHSLGGALSTLLYLELSLYQQINPNRMFLYTYGSPRVGNIDFVSFFYQNSLIKNSFRYVNNKDPIPHLPPAIKYTHIHNEIWLLEDKIISCSNKTLEEDINCSYSLYKALNIYDHMNYFDKKKEYNNMYEICLID